MRNLAAWGIDAAAVGEGLPDLSPDAEQAIACWNFCDGWAPERWPVFAALHAVADWPAVVQLQAVIRDEMRRKGRGVA